MKSNSKKCMFCRKTLVNEVFPMCLRCRLKTRNGAGAAGKVAGIVAGAATTLLGVAAVGLGGNNSGNNSANDSSNKGGSSNNDNQQ